MWGFMSVGAGFLEAGLLVGLGKLATAGVLIIVVGEGFIRVWGGLDID
jgi:hypothetical protein